MKVGRLSSGPNGPKALSMVHLRKWEKSQSVSHHSPTLNPINHIHNQLDFRALALVHPWVYAFIYQYPIGKNNKKKQSSDAIDNYNKPTDPPFSHTPFFLQIEVDTIFAAQRTEEERKREGGGRDWNSLPSSTRLVYLNCVQCRKSRWKPVLDW